MASIEKARINALAEKFNNLGLNVGKKELDWHDARRTDQECLQACVSENDTDNYKKSAQDIATALRVLGIVTSDPQLSHFIPYGPMWGIQEPSWDIIIPLSLIDTDKLEMWQTGAKMAQGKRMRINARSCG